MVKITLEFPTVDHAIAALGKLAGVQTVVSGAPMAAPVLVNTPRKGRSDAGKPRGPRNAPPAPEPNANGAGAGAAPATAASAAAPASAPSPEASKPAEQPTAPAATAEATEAEAQAAVQKLFESTMKTSAAENKSGAALQESKDLLARYGVKRIRDLQAGQRRAFVDEVNGILAGRVA